MNALLGSSVTADLLASSDSIHREQARSRLRRAFTLLELLTVIAIIGILAALIFPSVRSARVAANKARTKVRFSQWAAAIEGFRNEYGCYPAFHSSNLVNPPGQNSDPSTLHLFHDLLAARHRDGTALAPCTPGTNSQYPESQNRKLISFYSFSDADFTTAGSPAPGAGAANPGFIFSWK